MSAADAANPTPAIGLAAPNAPPMASYSLDDYARGTFDQAMQTSIGPEGALELLLDGNARYRERRAHAYDLNEQSARTTGGQYPFAAVLSCIDSRVPVEHVFNLGIGDAFVARVAGNVVDPALLGSLEYACAVAGTPLLVVLGHSKCGAVTSAVKDVKAGNITDLLALIRPSVEAEGDTQEDPDPDFVERVVRRNVRDQIAKLRRDSPMLADLERDGGLKIVGAVFHLGSGEVEVLD